LATKALKQHKTYKKQHMASKDLIPHRFQKGKSGNPNGRPRNPELPCIRSAIAAALSAPRGVRGDRTALDNVLERLVEMAEGGNVRAAEILMDRAFGRPLQSIAAEIEANAPPLKIVIAAHGKDLPADD
jgi:hypothetical protein